MTDYRQYAPATERNRQPILTVLKRVLPPAGTVLEIASGTGEHITFFASQLRHLRWIASEPTEQGRQSIQAWAEALPTDNLLLPPLNLDVSMRPWPIEVGDIETGDIKTDDIEAGTKTDRLEIDRERARSITAMVAINMIHICGWEMCEHLMAGAERVLPSAGRLYLYGPFKRSQQHTAPSNEAFDRMLQDRNPAWGIRDLEAVVATAQQHRLQLTEVIDMPANNFSVVFTRQ
ncbi:MAG: DUF938 domain-containing protein [Cyanobacteria bacterium J06649_5]